MRRELRARMRGGRSYLIAGLYALAISICVMAVYASVAQSGSAIVYHHVAAQAGRAIWTWGCALQALLLPLMVPAFTCGAITFERERDMLDLLLLTHQSPLQICLGKLAAGVGLGMMLLLSSVPVLALTFVLGGVSPGEMLASLAVLSTSVLAAGAFGLAVSTFLARTSAAGAVSYLVVGTTIIGVPILLQFLNLAHGLSESGSDAGILAMLLACMGIAFPPAVGMALVLYAFRRTRSDVRPDRVWWMLTVGLSWCGLLLILRLPGMAPLLLQGQGALLLIHPVAAILGLMQGPRTAGTPWSSAWNTLWLVCTVCYVLASVWFTYVATLRVRRLRVA